MKTAIWVVVYFTMCFLLFTGWMFAFAQYAPQLVLMDISLPFFNGYHWCSEIRKISKVPVIFITAFPERLLTGERPEPTFLITKPFQPETVKAAISQALFFHPARDRTPA